MQEPMFSVIVPVYKTERYIRQCIESVLEQTYKDFELILVDDGSPDSSGAICDEYAQTDPRIKVIHKENEGLVSARKTGLQNACGHYVISLDSDDYIVRDMLKILATCISDTSAEVVSFDHFRVYDEGQKTRCCDGVTEGFYVTEEALSNLRRQILYKESVGFFDYGISPCICFKAIEASLYRKYQFSVDNMIVVGEDLAVTMPMLLEAKSVYVLHQALYCYRITGTSIMGAYREKDMDDLENLLSYLDQEIDVKKNKMKKQIAAYTLSRINGFLFNSAQKVTSYLQFKEIAEQIGDDLFRRIRGYKSLISIKGNIIKLMLTYRCWWFWWFYCKGVRT